MITDEILWKAAEDTEAVLLEKIEPLGKDRHRFSDRFERKMKRLVWKESHPGLYRLRKATVGILLLLLVGGSIVLTFDSAARGAFIRYSQEYIRFLDW